MVLTDFAPMSFLLILFLTLVLGFRNKPRRYKSKRTLRCVCVVWGLGSNLEYHINLEGWTSFIILSCLSVFTTRVDGHKEQNLRELRIMLEELNKTTDIFTKSTASLYAPSPNEKECTKKAMYCYLLELRVTVTEEDESNEVLDYIIGLTDLYRNSSNCMGCPDCETHPVVNSTVFLESLITFIKILSSGTQNHSVCT